MPVPLRNASTTHWRALLRLMIAVLVLVAGCGSDPAPPQSTSTPPQQPPNWPEKLKDFRFRWSSAPEVGLDTGWAVPLRAYLESWLIINYTVNFDAGYPGFLRATPPALEPGSPDWIKTPFAQRQIRGDSNKQQFGDLNQRILGNEELYILRLEPLDTGFRAFVCDATYNVYEQTSGSTDFTPLYRDSSIHLDPDSSNMQVWRVEFSDRDLRGSTRPTAPTHPQRGPLPAPRTDVFGPWFVTGSQLVMFWWDSDHLGLPTDSPEYRQRRHEAQEAQKAMRQQCLDRYSLDAEQRASRATTVLNNPPPVEPALPGWPA